MCYSVCPIGSYRPSCEKARCPVVKGEGELLSRNKSVRPRSSDAFGALLTSVASEIRDKY
jgi:hypothetical protein